MNIHTIFRYGSFKKFSHIFYDYLFSRQRKIISSRNRSRQSVKSFQKSSKTEKLENSNKVKPIPKPEVLDVVKEATFNMYGDSFHYSLIMAAFIEPIPKYNYKLPFQIRIPRPIKTFNPEKNKKVELPVAQGGSKEMKKKTGEKKVSHSRDTKTTDVMNDLVVLTDDEILLEKRRFILPLMEANEAAEVFKEYKLMKTK